MGAADTAIAYAKAQIGKPYVWGAEGPDAFDCSGLIQAAYASAGIRLSRTTYTQIRDGSEVGRSDLAPGDLVFPNPGHVQLYIGSGQVIHAPNPRTVVKQVALGTFWRGRRVAAPATGHLDSAIDGASPVAIGYPGKEFLQNLNKIAEWITNPGVTRRIFIALAGVILVGIALYRVLKEIR